MTTLKLKGKKLYNVNSGQYTEIFDFSTNKPTVPNLQAGEPNFGIKARTGTHVTTWACANLVGSPLAGDITFSKFSSTVTLQIPQVLAAGNNSAAPIISVVVLPAYLCPPTTITKRISIIDNDLSINGIIEIADTGVITIGTGMTHAGAGVYAIDDMTATVGPAESGVLYDMITYLTA